MQHRNINAAMQSRAHVSRKILHAEQYEAASDYWLGAAPKEQKKTEVNEAVSNPTKMCSLWIWECISGMPMAHA